MEESLVANNMRRRSGELARKLFEILQEHPEGLSGKAILAQLEETLPANGKGTNQEHALLLWKHFEEMTRASVATIKAGWVLNNRDWWAVTDEGKEAYARFTDPEKFIVEAGRRSSKGWVSVNFPRAYFTAGKFKDQLTAEYRAVRRIGLRQLFGKAFGSNASWQEILPLQTPRRIKIPDLKLTTFDDLLNYLNSTGATYAQGGHAIYLSPSSLRRSAFRELTTNYPPDAGLKIVKEQGGVDESSYIHGTSKGDSLIHLKSVHQHRHLTLVANLLFAQGLGARLYDLIELDCGGHLWTAYVVEHVGGSTPSLQECEAGIARIRELDAQGLIRVILPEGFDDEEFECPSCCNNALTSERGEFRYIDFQNFMLVNYESFLTETAVRAVEKSHFGDTSVVRGGRYLYQSVPGVNLPGKRSVEERMPVIKQLMNKAGVSVENRLALDLGCNIGMMMAQYLKLGAKWCHGWDRAYVTPHTEKLLLALGCTRFSTTGGDISQQQPVEENLPAFLRPSLEGCVISYLAVRGHLGWLDAFSRIPWSFLIYEGHEGETQDEFEQHMAQFRELVNFKLAGVQTYRDGDSDERTLAILLREA
jgi:hypothetical protein